MTNSYNTICRILFDSVEATKHDKISKQGAAIQERFFLIQKECPKLLPDLIFDESGITPYSEELDQILYQLEVGEILSTGNPDFKEYQIKKHEYLQARGNAARNKYELQKAVNLFKDIMVE